MSLTAHCPIGELYIAIPKNKINPIELANKISSQTVDIYNSAKKAQDSFKKTSDGIMEVMDKIKDGKGSLLSKTSKINKIISTQHIAHLIN